MTGEFSTLGLTCQVLALIWLHPDNFYLSSLSSRPETRDPAIDPIPIRSLLRDGPAAAISEAAGLGPELAATAGRRELGRQVAGEPVDPCRAGPSRRGSGA